MHTLVHIPTGLSTPELEIMLSKAQGALDAGEELTVVTCAGGPGYACSLNIYGVRATCGVCKAMVEKGLALLEGNFERIETPSCVPLPTMNSTRKKLLTDRWAMKAYAPNGADVGQASYSSYIGLSRDQDLEGAIAQRALHKLLATTEMLSEWFRNLISACEIGRVVLYNGRQNQYRPLLRAAQQAALPVDVMEYSGQDANCVYVFENQLPQDLEVLEAAINRCWETFSGDTEKAAEEFYSMKRAGGVVNDLRSYVKNQTRGLLPKDWDATKHNVAIFNSSEDEYTAVGGEYDKALYVNQTEAMHRLCESLKDDPDVVLWLRIHPNLAGVCWSFAEKLLLLGERYKNVRIIPGDSKVSTYDLLDACNTAVSFGSTMGIEAVYWGKPSILLGRCVYERFGSVYVASTHEEAVKLIRTRNLALLPAEGAMKIAVFWRRGGHTLSHFSGTRSEGFRFHNQLLQKSWIENISYTAAKFVEKIILERWINVNFGRSKSVVSKYRQETSDIAMRRTTS